MAAAGIHLMRVFLFGSYKAPREVTWMTGVVLLLLILGVSLSGYLLPWDQKAYWATTVSINIARSTPLVGEAMASAMRGGPDLGALTLGRWYSAHVILLPATLVMFVVAHIALMRRHGISGPIRPRVGPKIPFFPWHVVKDTVVMAAVFALLFIIAVNLPANLDEVANPADTTYDPRPEWYFLWLFQLLKYFHGALEPIAILVIPGLLAAFLFTLPFLDRGADRHPFWSARRISTVVMLSIGAGIMSLTVLGLLDRPERYSPNDWGPQSLAGYQLVTSKTGTCARCHVEGGPAANLADAPATRDDGWVLGHLRDPVVIAPGVRSPDEPAPPPQVTPLQANAALAYLRRVRAGGVPPVLSEEDRLATTLFAKICVNCHRISGEGSQTAPHLTRVGARRTAASIRRILIDPASELPDATMPIFNGRLNDQETDALTQYLAKRH